MKVLNMCIYVSNHGVICQLQINRAGGKPILRLSTLLQVKNSLGGKDRN